MTIVYPASQVLPYNNHCLSRVSGIPSLMLLDEKLQVITKNGRGYVESDPEGKVGTSSVI